MQKSSVHASNEFKKNKPAVNFSQSTERTKTAAKTPNERVKPVGKIEIKNNTMQGKQMLENRRLSKINMLTEDAKLPVIDCTETQESIPHEGYNPMNPTGVAEMRTFKNSGDFRLGDLIEQAEKEKENYDSQIKN